MNFYRIFFLFCFLVHAVLVIFGLQWVAAECLLKVVPHTILISSNGSFHQESQGGELEMVSSGLISEALLSCVEV